MSVIKNNPVELAVAAAFVGGQVSGESVTGFAESVAKSLESAGVETTGWQDAVKKWVGAEQNSTWRTQASDLLVANKDALDTLAQGIEALARIPGMQRGAYNPATVADWLFQQGLSEDGQKFDAAELVANPAFLNKGQFAGFPPGTVPSSEMSAGRTRQGAFPIRIDTSSIESPAATRLSESMSTMWGFLQDRGSVGGDNINTLTRQAYNQFGVREVLQNLEDRGVKDGRVLLVTGYETPIEDLLDSDRIKEVVVADLSDHAANLVADKYKHHPNARKLKIKVTDFSGIDAQAQSDAAKQFGQHDPGEVPPEVSQAWFQSVAAGEHQVDVDFESGSFDAVHLPFVAGSLHFGPLTEAIADKKKGYYGYDDFVGAKALATDAAAGAQTAAMKHAFDEAGRITKDGGLVVANLWARPHTEPSEGDIRLSDTPVTKAAFQDLVDGFQQRFSGNPQPTLPHTVGHIFTRQV